ncbi:MAG TPA: glycoside hydrolase family 3 N-terminal domain-containing protein [Bacteroidales bacterium]|nr:glycoside hydrolase family 3 N-terminal domain-containing protein [Bacteroidales bacterium]
MAKTTKQPDTSNAPYKNPKLSVQARVKDLLSRMTIDEKAWQLMGLWNGGIEDFNDDFFKDKEKVKATFSNGANSVHPAFWHIKETVEQRNKLQKYFVEETRLGIPLLFVDEGQHGMMRYDATGFPQAIGLACSWDPDLFEKVYSTVAKEMRSRGTHHALTPVIDVCREPRWGRVEETYGEDPYLNGTLSCAAVKGLQGSSDGSIGKDNVAATLKHLVGHGQAESGQNTAPANYSLRVLRDFHMPPFKMCIDKVNPASVMPSYNEVDGLPSHANKWLLKDVLRKEWGYKGMIVSDYYGIEQLCNKHFVVEDMKKAAEVAFNTGVQSEFPQGNCYKYLPELVKEGKIAQADIDKAVSQVLELKFKLGLFENPYVDLNRAVEISKDKKSRELALRAAHESIVLLKNDGLLPLKKNKYGKIAVIGPCAKDVFMGGYAGEPYQKVSLFDGIKEKVGNKTELLFAQGVKLTDNAQIPYFNWKLDEIKLPSPEENMKLIKAAVDVAKKADITILAIGENEHLCREAWAKTHIGDDMTLDLICQQEDLVKAIVETGKPVVVYLMHGRPLSINYIEKNVPAIVDGWYMGQETGTAAADIIFGDVNPSGKLTITVPKSVGQLPLFYNHKPSTQLMDYISMDNKPLYHFGYGLSYTKFKYSDPKLDKQKIKVDGSVKVKVDVTNAGKMAGDEILQLYIRDKVSPVTRPVKELKGFERVSLKPGETKKVTFELTPEHLAYHNVDMKFVVEPGDFEIMVGSSSRDEDLLRTTLTVG